MRRLLVLAILLTVLLSAAPAEARSLFIVEGKGWGHGVGMSQWGARALAEAGWTYDQILAYYYAGTHLDTRSTRTIPVLLADRRSSLRVGSDAAFGVGAKTHAAGNPLVTPTGDGRIRVDGFSTPFASPLTFSPGSAPLELNGSGYRGRLVVSWVSGRLRAANRLGSEAYVKGVVSREMPSDWAPEALKAQATAARSYAFASGGHCGGYFCADTRDQVYGGIAAERPTTNAAVEATSRQIVEHEDAIAQTFFHSSSGGRTAASADVWGGSVAYLQSKDDFDLIPANPHTYWKLLFSGAKLGNKLGTPTPRDATVARNGSGRAASMTVSGSGWTSTLSGGTVQARLGLKSTRFWVSVQTLSARATRITYGSKTTVDAFTRRVTATLQRRAAGSSSWTDMTPVQGPLAVSVAPKKSTTFRLGSSLATRPAVSVAVAVKVRFALTSPPDSLKGIVRPLSMAGRTVVILRNGTRVATTTVRADGSFRANFNVTPGTYRARVVPPSGSGLVTGTSPRLTVVG